METEAKVYDFAAERAKRPEVKSLYLELKGDGTMQAKLRAQVKRRIEAERKEKNRQVKREYLKRD